jgi:NAD+ synthetase
MLKDCEHTMYQIQNNTLEYINKHKIKSLVIGVSGGIDSALCCALAKPVCDKLNISLIGRSIPIVTNKQDELDRAINIGKCFCTDFDEVYIERTYTQTLLDMNEQLEWTDIQKGNIKARLRMIYLYNLAYLYHGMVLSTDNYTELLLGFWTLHGDVGDFGMVQSLWKTEVYDLAKYMTELETITSEQKLALLQCINATPTDGLGITNSDLDQLEADSYLEVDALLQTYLKNGNCKDHPVIKRHLATEYKRNNPYNIKRKLIV